MSLPKLKVRDNLSIVLGSTEVTLSASEGLDLAEDLARKSFRKVLQEEAEKTKSAAGPRRSARGSKRGNIAAGALAAVLLIGGAVPGKAQSTVNPNVPAQNAPINSAPLRANFAATYADINALATMRYGTSAPSPAYRFMTWADTTSSPYQLKIFDGTQWVAFATLNPSTHVYAPLFSTGSFTATAPLVATSPGSGQINYALASTAAGNVIANCTSGAAAPIASTWTACLDQNIGSAQGSISTRGATAWGVLAPGTAGFPLVSGGAGANLSYARLGLAAGGTDADLSATGGASQVLRQSTSGGAVTVGQISAGDLSDGTSGTGPVVLATSPTLTTPNIGAATATSINGVTWPSSGTSGGALYFSSTSAVASSGLLTQYGIIYGGGAGAAPVATAAGTNNQILVGQTSAAPIWNTASTWLDNTIGSTQYTVAQRGASTWGAVVAAPCSANNWMTAIGTCAQPAFSNLSGSIAAGQIPNTTITNAMLNGITAWTNGTAGAIGYTGGNVGIGPAIAGYAHGAIPNHVISGAMPSAGTGGILNIISTDSQASDKGGQLFLGGYTTAQTTSNNFAAITGYKENSTAGQNGGYFTIATRQNAVGLSERLRITSAGNVGIGTTSPTAQLDVASTVRFRNLVGPNCVSVDANGNAGVTSCGGSANNAAGTAGMVQFNAGGTSFAADTNFFWDNTNKRLGIGTSTPSVPLHVVGASTFTAVPTLPTQTANTIFAGPGSGSAAAPTFRALVSADLPSLAGIVFAENFAGADCGAKINAATASFAGAQGEVWVNVATCGATWTTAVTIPNKASVRLTQCSTVTTSNTITLGQSSALFGSVPAGMGVGNTSIPCTIKAANGTNLSSVVLLNDSWGALRDIVIDGNKANNSSGGAAIRILADKSDIANVTAQNAKTHGFFFDSSVYGFGAPGTAKLSKVMAFTNDLDGLHLYGTNDTFVVESEFQGNTRAQVFLDDSSALRMIGSDLAGNNYGIYASCTSPGRGSYINQFTNNMIAGNQWNIYVEGWSAGGRCADSWVITGNAITQGSGIPDATTNSIQLSDVSDYTVTGNTISVGASPHRYANAINIVETASGRGGTNNVRGNAISGNWVNASPIQDTVVYKSDLVSSTVTSGSAVSCTNLGVANVTSIPIAAGDWDVSISGYFAMGSSTPVNSLVVSISGSNSGIDTTPGRFGSFTGNAIVLTNNTYKSLNTGPVRISSQTATTLYFNAYAEFSGTCAAFGMIQAKKAY